MEKTVRIKRREFVKTAAKATAAFGLPALLLRGSPGNDIRIAVVGLGARNVVGGTGGRGHVVMKAFQKVPGAKIVALCDVDRDILEFGRRELERQGVAVTTQVDVRRVLDDKSVDAVVLATPNHWHALGTIWACQAGKDVYVEKPFSHNLWEGRQMMAAARKYDRMVQVGTHRRSSELLPQIFSYLRSGSIGRIRFAHALSYRSRPGIGKVSTPTPIPAAVDYDLWCGPAPKGPLRRKQLHYEWHWMWETGNGEMGNLGVHVIDVCRWALEQPQPPRAALSIGGRFAVDDDGETPNTQIAFFDYQPAPIISEIRNVAWQAGSKRAGTVGTFRNGSGRGVVIVCEGGHFAGDFTGGTVFDNDGKKVKTFGGEKVNDAEVSHAANFLAAVRSRNPSLLKAEAKEGHVSTSCCHLANISHRLGRASSSEQIQSHLRSNTEILDAFERCRDHLRENGVDLAATPAVLGQWVTYDAAAERFLGENAAAADRLSKREGRAPFIVPTMV